MTGPTGLTTRFTHDALGRLVGVQDPDGEAGRIEYRGETLLVTAVVRGDGTRETFDYDAQANLLTVKDAAETLATFAYYPDGLVRSAKVWGAGARTYTYDPSGRVAAVTDALGAATRYEYDARGQVVRTVNPLGAVASATYDARGRLTSETDPGGAVQRYEYDAGGRLSRVIGPGGATWSYEYDAAGRRAAVVDPAGRRLRFEVDRARQQVALVHPDGRRELSRVDAAGRLVERTDALGLTARYAYDATGRLVGEAFPGGQQVRYTYDAQGRLAGEEDGLGARRAFAWDPRGRLASVTDQSGAVARYRYDSLGRPVALQTPLGHEIRFGYDGGEHLREVVTAAGDVARYEHDAEGRLTAIQLPGGGGTRLVYDAAGRLASMTLPGGGQVRHSYDLAGERTATTDPAGRTTTFAHDAAGRLREETRPDGRKVRYRYGPLDELLEVDDGAYPVRYVHDAAGRVVAVEYPAIGRAVRYTYDAAGLLAELTSPSGARIRYRYDPLKRLAAIVLPDGAEIAFAYDQGDRLRTVRFPHGVTGEWQLDAGGDLRTLVYTDAAGGLLASWDYERDAAGNPTRVTRNRAVERLYRYDADGRLVEEGSPAGGGAVRYDYRPGGDRARRAAGGVTDYAYDGDGRLVSAGAERFIHDAAGRIVQRAGSSGTATYQYDDGDHLVRVTAPDGQVTTLGYAPTGERAWRQDARGATWLVYDGANLLEELDQAGRSIALYVHAPGLDRPLAMLRDGRPYFYHADGTGTIALLTDDQGKVAAAYETDAFGVTRAARAGVANPFLFHGREHEAALGLYYFRARWYDPVLGRFLGPDPLLGTPGDPAGLNRYAFARNAPTRYGDPLGLAAWQIDFGYWARRGIRKAEINRLVGEEYARIMSQTSNHSPAARRVAFNNARFRVESALTSYAGAAEAPGARIVSGARGYLGSPNRAGFPFLAGDPGVRPAPPPSYPPGAANLKPLVSSQPGFSPARLAEFRAANNHVVLEMPVRPRGADITGGQTTAPPRPPGPGGGGTTGTGGPGTPPGGGGGARGGSGPPGPPPPGGSTAAAGITKGVGTSAVSGAISGGVLGGTLAGLDCYASGGSKKDCAVAVGVGTAIGAPVGALGGAAGTVVINAIQQGAIRGVVTAATGSAAAGTAATAVAGGALVGVTAYGSYQGGKIIGRAINTAIYGTPQQQQRSGSALAVADARLVDLYEVRKLINDEVAGLRRRIKEAQELRNAFAAATGAAGGAGLLPQGYDRAVEQLGRGCTPALQKLATIRQAGDETLPGAREATGKAATPDGPPESTEAMQRVLDELRKLGPKLKPVARTASELGPALRSLGDAAQILNGATEKEGELTKKIAAYDRLTTQLQEDANRTEALVQRFDAAKARAEEILVALAGQVTGNDVATLAARRERIARAEVGGDAPAAIKEARALVASSDAEVAAARTRVADTFSRVTRDREGLAACEPLLKDGVQGTAKTALAGAKEVDGLLAGIKASLQGRLRGLEQIERTDTQTAKQAKERLDAAGTEEERAKIRAVQQRVETRLKAAQKELPIVRQGDRALDEAKQATASILTLLGD